ncbi:MAG: hypothetical protein LBD82_03325 [Deltaproteobacteria bacterium]|nr:hypothetical protein [Deltaproteobacteria bacterium]
MNAEHYLGALIGMGNAYSLIIGWSFLSMGIRGAVGFSALSAAMFLPGRISAAWVVHSMLSGLVCLLLTKQLAGNLVDPFLPGFVGSALPLLIGSIKGKRGA